MSDLLASEKRKLEKLLQMGGGYVLDFNNRTFAEFVDEKVRRNIDDPLYDNGSNSKAQRLRKFWDTEPNQLVGRLLDALIYHRCEGQAFSAETRALQDDCLRIAFRLKSTPSVAEADVFSAPVDDRDFEALATHVLDAIAKNEPQAALDRLHTYVVRWSRTRCENCGIAVPREKPLHSMWGEYVRALKDAGQIDSEMTERILKSTISVFESFNGVRNNQSLAHDNAMLNYEESLLIFNYVASTIRFVMKLEVRAAAARAASNG